MTADELAREARAKHTWPARFRSEEEIGGVKLLGQMKHMPHLGPGFKYLRYLKIGYDDMTHNPCINKYEFTTGATSPMVQTETFMKWKVWHLCGI